MCRGNGLNYGYDYFGEKTGRVMYAQNLNDATLDRSYDYDQVGRLQTSFTGSAARAHMGIGGSWLSDGPYAAQSNGYDVWGNSTSRDGWGGANPLYTATYTNNRRAGLTYDAAGNVTNDGGQDFLYNAIGQQVKASYSGYILQQSYNGDRLRAKKDENGAVTYVLRSSVLGGQIVAELNGSGAWTRGYVYLGGQLVALQGGSGGAVSWVHQDPVTKSQRITNSSGTIISTIDLDPWGGETSRSSSAGVPTASVYQLRSRLNRRGRCDEPEV